MASRTWALVIDARRARILRGFENPDGVPPQEMASEAASHHLRRLLDTDSTTVGASDAVVDPIMRDMVNFTRQILEFLDMHHRAGDFDQLAIIAAPPMLDVVRQDLSANLKRVVVMEHPFNLTAVPGPELFEDVGNLIREARNRPGLE